jgi:hypothetical protein
VALRKIGGQPGKSRVTGILESPISRARPRSNYLNWAKDRSPPRIIRQVEFERERARYAALVSSPSDVMAERARVDAVAARLNGEFAGLAEIEVIRWETGFYTADRPFQQAIDEVIDRMQATDMVVCILWKRVGSELDPSKWRKPNGSTYESGTVLEFETTLAVSRERRGLPDVFLFRKDAPIAYSPSAFEVERAQHLLLESVWQRRTATDSGHNLGGYQHFADVDDFERQLELCLRQWLERHGIVRRTVWDRRLKGSPEGRD